MILIGIAVLCGLMMILSLFLNVPIPRGSKVDNRYYTYYQNFIGIYYISVENAFALYNHGSWGYLKDVDKESFKVLSYSWAKDKNHVWHGDDVFENVDVNSFHINESGVPVDRDHVYVWNDDYEWVPSQSGIDPKTAEYFISQEYSYRYNWLRDKDNVYYRDKKVDVDRNTFSSFAYSYYFIDKDYIYITRRNDEGQGNRDLIRIDSIQSPLETTNQGEIYIRNGRNIIYCDRIILKDVDVQRFEKVNYNILVVNDMLFYNGEPFLKDSINVPEARFYYYGITADNENVFWGHQRLDDVDAATFREINDDTFEDKDYIYTIKDFSQRKSFDKSPFDKRKKLLRSKEDENGDNNRSVIAFRVILALFLGILSFRIAHL